MGAATEFRSPHRPDAPVYLSTVEDLITYLWTGIGFDLVPRSPLNLVLRGNLVPATRHLSVNPANHPGEARDVSIILEGAC
jgi:hypothetical protein